MQFEINYDKERKNLHGNTITFAQKFNKSQPKFKIRKKKGFIEPCPGYYDTDIKLCEMNRNCDRAPDMAGQANRS